jgi:hypothetical protein
MGVMMKKLHKSKAAGQLPEQEVSTPSTTEPEPANGMATQNAAAEEQFLCVTVREARNLVAKDYDTASSDP